MNFRTRPAPRRRLQRTLPAPRRSLLALCLLLLAGTAAAQSSSPEDRLRELETRLAEQDRQLGALQQLVADQQAALQALSQELGASQLDELRARGAQAGPALPPVAAIGQVAAVPAPPGASGRASADTGAVAQTEAQPRVGRPPEPEERPPEVARIFEQPGVLTPAGSFVLEPALQFSYSSNDRVALVGYTVIPAILIGLIDVRQVKTTGLTAALALRYGLGGRFELEAKAPFAYINGDTVSREIFTGSAQDKVFQADGKGLGDVEVTARYQLNRPAASGPFYVAWLRYKARNGRDLFEVVTDCVTRCVANATGTGLPLELPVGSGFSALQPGVTWLYASDPVVFFGSLSYLHNFKRENVSRTVLSGAPEGYPQTTTEPLGTLEAGDIIGFNFGMGLALNERAALSFGYDQSIVGRTKQNGEDAPGAVRIVLGTLVVGGSYRLSERTSLNVALGVGVTRDTPDVSLAVRMPISF